MHCWGDSALVCCFHTAAVGRIYLLMRGRIFLSRYFFVRTLWTVTLSVLDVSQSLLCLGIACVCSSKMQILLPEMEGCFLKIFFFLSINGLYILEQVQIYRKIEQIIQRVPICPTHIYTISPSVINILHFGDICYT